MCLRVLTFLKNKLLEKLKQEQGKHWQEMLLRPLVFSQVKYSNISAKKSVPLEPSVMSCICPEAVCASESRELHFELQLQAPETLVPSRAITHIIAALDRRKEARRKRRAEQRAGSEAGAQQSLPSRLVADISEES